jgi:hypothetical protein
MENRTVEELNKEIKDYCKKWKEILFLGLWEIKIYIRDYVEDSDTYATCSSSWKYLTATIEFSHLLIKDKSGQEIEKIVIHELVHVLLNETKEDGIDHQERVTSHLTIALYDMGTNKE